MSYQLYAQPNLAGSDVIRNFNLWSEYLLVDTIEGDPIKITLQVADDNAETNSFISSSFTRNFRLPKSPNNDKLFKFATDVNNISYNPRLPLNAYITTDGSLFSQGFIFLNSVSMNSKTGAGFYIVSFVNEVGSFITSMGDKYLSDLDTSELTHTRNYTNILESWKATNGFSFSQISATAGLVDGNVLYPLMEWGYEYNADGSVNTNLTNTISQHACSSSFLKNTNALYQNQFKPLVRTSWIWNRIFREAGFSFTYSSTPLVDNLFDTSKWKCSYTIQDSTNRARLITPGYSLSSLKYITNAKSAGVWVDSDLPSIETGINGQLNSTGQLNTINGRYIVPVTGSYSVRPFYNFTALLQTTSAFQNYAATFSCRLYNYTTDTELFVWPVDSFTGTSNLNAQASILCYTVGTKAAHNLQLNLDHEIKIQTRMDITNTSGGTPPFLFINFNQDLVQMEVNPTASISNVVKPTFTSKMKQKDYIISITKKFKLVFEETKNKSVLQIIPWREWIGQGINLDWSDKLDGNTDFVFEPLYNTKKKTITITDKTDTDWCNQYYETRTKRLYGEFKYDSNIQTLSDEEKIETELSPTALATFGICNSATRNEGDSRFVILSMTKDDNPLTNVGKREAIEPNVRLCYYNGTASIPNVSNATHWHIRNDLNVAQALNYRALVSNFLLWPETGVADREQTKQTGLEQFDINMANSDYLPYMEGFFLRTNNDAAAIYHNDYLNLFYDRPFFGFMNRKATCRLILYDSDLVNFRFNTRVFVNGSWWFVSKIKDYQIGVGGSTEVELYQFGYANAKL